MINKTRLTKKNIWKLTQYFIVVNVLIFLLFKISLA